MVKEKNYPKKRYNITSYDNHIQAKGSRYEQVSCKHVGYNDNAEHKHLKKNCT